VQQQNLKPAHRTEKNFSKSETEEFREQSDQGGDRGTLFLMCLSTLGDKPVTNQSMR